MATVTESSRLCNIRANNKFMWETNVTTMACLCDNCTDAGISGFGRQLVEMTEGAKSRSIEDDDDHTA